MVTGRDAISVAGKKEKCKRRKELRRDNVLEFSVRSSDEKQRMERLDSYFPVFSNSHLRYFPVGQFVHPSLPVPLASA